MSTSPQTKKIGISGLAAYVPPYRVWLEDWCEWTGDQWPKVREVVGRSFRVRGPEHSVYTMAATDGETEKMVVVLPDGRMAKAVFETPVAMASPPAE